MDAVGIDLDNTLICYDRVWPLGLRALGITAPKGMQEKRALRDWLRQQPEGEAAWQRLQAHAYGPGLAQAALAPGARAFLAACAAQGVPVSIVSHKTEHAAADPDGVNLREAARAWLRDAGIVGPGGAVPESQLYFEDTRAEKVRRIAALGCTHFIDDLDETFLEPEFPAAITTIQYAPGDTPDDARPWLRFQDWPYITEYFAQRWDDAERAAIADLVSTRDAAVSAVHRLPGGRNSRVYRVSLADGSSLAAKRYVREDGRARMQTEFDAFRVLHDAGMQQVPRAIAKDEEHLVAIYEYAEGVTASDEITSDAIDACVAFVADLIQHSRETLQWKGEAKEAFVSFEGLLATIASRRAAFDGLDDSQGDTVAVRGFLTDAFDPALDEVSAWVAERLQARGMARDAAIPDAQRLLSPSDFGLHNAVQRTDGSICFLDFEYFGWDDPVKLVSDFVLHPAMALDEPLRRRFVRGVMPAIPDPGFAYRLPLAHALFGLKWCLILLNEYLPAHRARRAFAGNASEKDVLLPEQLEKARRMLSHVLGQYREFPYL